jgi:hypothetical protein
MNFKELEDWIKNDLANQAVVLMEEKNDPDEILSSALFVIFLL